MDAIAVTVVTGFLGAGKTTLLGRWLRAYAPAEVAVIVNELAAVSVDSDLLRERAETILQITGGCICCTTFQELVRALSALEACSLKRIFVETSGAASPAGVVRAVHRVQGMRLDGIVTVVDAAGALGIDEPLADLAAEQLGYADVVVLSHADRANDSQMNAARAAVARANPVAVIAPAARGVMNQDQPMEALLAGRHTDLPLMIPQARDHQRIETLALSAEGELDEERFGDWMENDLGQHAGQLLRAKGIVAISGIDQRTILQGVADRMEVTLGAPWGNAPRRSQFVVIGFGLNQAQLAGGFANCIASDGGIPGPPSLSKKLA